MLARLVSVKDEIVGNGVSRTEVNNAGAFGLSNRVALNDVAVSFAIHTAPIRVSNCIVGNDVFFGPGIDDNSPADSVDGVADHAHTSITSRVAHDVGNIDPDLFTILNYTTVDGYISTVIEAHAEFDFPDRAAADNGEAREMIDFNRFGPEIFEVAVANRDVPHVVKSCAATEKVLEGAICDPHST